MAATGKTADPVFVTGPQDSLATVDVYAQTTPSTPTNTQPPSSDLVDANADLLTQALAATNPNTTIQCPAVPGAPTTPTKASSTVQNVTGVNAGTVADLGATLANDLFKAVGYAGALVTGFETGGVPGALNVAGSLMNQNPQLSIVYNSVVKAQSATQLATAQGISAFMNAFSANGDVAQVFDMTSKFAVMGTLFKSACGLQIPGILSDIVGQFTGKDITSFLTGQILSALQNASLNALALILEHVSPQVIMMVAPNAIGILLAAYKLPYGVTWPTENDYNALNNVLVAINPNWYQYNRNGVWINNLEPFEAASKDALATLSLNPDYQTAILIAPNYPPVDMIGLARQQFRMAYIPESNVA